MKTTGFEDILLKRIKTKTKPFTIYDLNNDLGRNTLVISEGFRKFVKYGIIRVYKHFETELNGKKYFMQSFNNPIYYILNGHSEHTNDVNQETNTL